MKKLNRMVALSILAALVLALVAVAPASAGKPEHFVLEWEEYWDMIDCGDFIIQNHNWGKMYVVIDWEAMRATIRRQGEDALYRTDGIGPTYSSKGAWVTVYRLGMGKGYMDLGGTPIVVPGAGVVLISAGRVYYDNEGNEIAKTGIDQLVEGDIDKICAAYR